MRLTACRPAEVRARTNGEPKPEQAAPVPLHITMLENCQTSLQTHIVLKQLDIAPTLRGRERTCEPGELPDGFGVDCFLATLADNPQ